MKKIFQSKKVFLLSFLIPFFYISLLLYNYSTWNSINKCGGWQGDTYNCSFFQYYSGGENFIIFEYIFIFILSIYLFFLLLSIYLILNNYKKSGYILFSFLLFPVCVFILGIIFQKFFQ
jgi:hypothetical protein